MKVLVQGKEYKIGFKHRFFDKEPGATQFFRACTLCTICEGGKTLSTGYALCVMADNFVKATGRRIALTRALAGFPREVRAEFWAQYWYSL